MHTHYLYIVEMPGRTGHDGKSKQNYENSTICQRRNILGRDEKLQPRSRCVGACFRSSHLWQRILDQPRRTCEPKPMQNFNMFLNEAASYESFLALTSLLKTHSSSDLMKDYNLRNQDFSTLWIIVYMKRRTDFPQACPHWGKAKIRTLIFKSCDKILCQEEH